MKRARSCIDTGAAEVHAGQQSMLGMLPQPLCGLHLLSAVMGHLAAHLCRPRPPLIPKGCTDALSVLHRWQRLSAWVASQVLDCLHLVLDASLAGNILCCGCVQGRTSGVC